MSTGIPKDRSEAYSVTGDAITATLKIGVAIFLVTTIGYSLIHRFKILDEIYSARSYLYPSLTPNIPPEKEGKGPKKSIKSKIYLNKDSRSNSQSNRNNQSIQDELVSSEAQLDLEGNDNENETIN